MAKPSALYKWYKREAKSRQLTYPAIARATGIGDQSYISRQLKGERSITPAQAERYEALSGIAMMTILKESKPAGKSRHSPKVRERRGAW